MDTIPDIDYKLGVEPEFLGFFGSFFEHFLPACGLEWWKIMFFLVDTNLFYNLESFREELYELVVYLIYLVSEIGEHICGGKEIKMVFCCHSDRSGGIPLESTFETGEF